MKTTGMLFTVLVLTLGCACGPKHRANPDKPDKPDVRSPKTPVENCNAGVVHACDAIVEYWSERAILPEGQGDKAKADARALRRACDERDLASACMGLALMYKYGTASGARDRATSKKYWKRVAELKTINGFRGKQPSAEGKRVLAATRAACENGRAHSCLQAAWAAYAAVQRSKSIADAYAHYRRACELGSGKGCHWAGHFVYTYPDLKLAKDAENLLRRGCDKLKAPGACDELGLYLEKVKKTPDAAIPLFKASCAAGLRTACFHLGLARDRKGATLEAVELLLKACSAGEKKACGALAAKVTQGCTIDLGSSAPAGVGARAMAAAKAFCNKAADSPATAPNCKRVTACQ